MSTNLLEPKHGNHDSPDPLLAINNLKVHFFARKGMFQRVTIRAVNGVSLGLRRGETLAIVGESGSGKTTLGRASLRLVKPSAGTIVFDGVDITGLGESELKGFRRRAQAVFQDPYSSLNPYMNISQIVQEPMVVHGLGSRDERESRVRKALEDVRLNPVDGVMSKHPHTLSGGQRQRVGIARALVLRPEYIVADEPVSMIDASSRAEILYLMQELKQAYSLAFLYITHDIASARHFADRIAVMYLGNIVERGIPSSIVAEPKHPYTQALIAAVPEPDPTNRLRQRPVIPGEPPSPANIPNGCAFHSRCPKVMRGLCDVEKPELKEIGGGQAVACFLYEDIVDRRAKDVSSEPESLTQDEGQRLEND
ncbi:ABC transporter ATP-binding protein [Dehalococcoidia bacterium]|nr:ABC transporter ATP-binding protein [Dehalococcoidia bacterium]